MVSGDVLSRKYPPPQLPETFPVSHPGYKQTVLCKPNKTIFYQPKHIGLSALLQQPQSCLLLPTSTYEQPEGLP